MIQEEPKKTAQQGNENSLSMVPSLIEIREFAAILKVSTRTIWRLVSSGEAPAPLRIGGSCRWRLKEVERWIEGNCPTQKKHTRT